MRLSWSNSFHIRHLVNWKKIQLYSRWDEWSQSNHCQLRVKPTSRSFASTSSMPFWILFVSRLPTNSVCLSQNWLPVILSFIASCLEPPTIYLTTSEQSKYFNNMMTFPSIEKVLKIWEQERYLQGIHVIFGRSGIPSFWLFIFQLWHFVMPAHNGDLMFMK